MWSAKKRKSEQNFSTERKLNVVEDQVKDFSAFKAAVRLIGDDKHTLSFLSLNVCAHLCSCAASLALYYKYIVFGLQSFFMHLVFAFCGCLCLITMLL